MRSTFRLPNSSACRIGSNSTRSMSRLTTFRGRRLSKIGGRDRLSSFRATAAGGAASERAYARSAESATAFICCDLRVYRPRFLALFRHQRRRDAAYPPIAAVRGRAVRAGQFPCSGSRAAPASGSACPRTSWPIAIVCRLIIGPAASSATPTGLASLGARP